MNSSIICLSLLFFVPTLSAGRDCESSDGYIRDHRDNVTDNCDQECGWMQCGDVCIKHRLGNGVTVMVRGFTLVVEHFTVAWITLLTTEHSAVSTVMMMEIVHREEW